jgi:hypothetical protein
MDCRSFFASSPHMLMFCHSDLLIHFISLNFHRLSADPCIHRYVLSRSNDLQPVLQVPSILCILPQPTDDILAIIGIQVHDRLGQQFPVQFPVLLDDQAVSPPFQPNTLVDSVTITFIEFRKFRRKNSVSCCTRRSSEKPSDIARLSADGKECE